MCRFRSGVAVWHETGVKVYMLPGEDGHSEIRRHYNITDDHSGLGHKQCPVEFIPRGELDEYDKYELVYDDDRPRWVTDDVEADIIRQMRRDVKTVDWADWSGYLDLRGTGITSLPDNLSVGGSLYLTGTGITKIPKTATIGGNIYY